jgi:Carbonic anhydrase
MCFVIVQKIILCGHYDCGGVKAALRNHDHGIIEQWIMGIRDVARYHRKVLYVYTHHTNCYTVLSLQYCTLIILYCILECSLQYCTLILLYSILYCRFNTVQHCFDTAVLHHEVVSLICIVQYTLHESSDEYCVLVILHHLTHVQLHVYSSTHLHATCVMLLHCFMIDQNRNCVL